MKPKNLLLGFGLLLIAILAYGLLAPKMGLFLDDWYIISTYRFFGVSGFVDYFRGDRPLLSSVYLVFMPLFKDSILAWQIFAIFTKWLSALAFWQLLRLLLPGKELIAYAAAMLFGIYPGFKFHYFVIMYSQTYFLLTLYFLSYIFMILALRRGKKGWPLLLAALFCQFLGIAPMEYFYGLELVRPVVLYLSIQNNGKKRARLIETLKAWLPYALVFLGFTAVRVFSSQNFGYQINLLDQLRNAPAETMVELLMKILRGLTDALVNVWFTARGLLSLDLGFRAFVLRAGLLISAALLAFLFFKLTLRNKETQNARSSPWLLLLAAFSVLASMAPYLFAGFQVNMDFPNNRFMLALSVGASLFIVVLVDQLFRTQTQKIALLAVLVSFCVGANYLIAQDYRAAWQKQTKFFTELTWRAPKMEEKTTLISPNLPFSQLFSGTSLTAPLNLIYAPQTQGNPIPYQLILAATNERVYIPSITADQPINARLRSFLFQGNTSDMIVFHAPEKGCLQFLKPTSNPAAFFDQPDAELWRQLLPLSDLSRVHNDSTQTQVPENYFGAVNPQTWCYYYEKAELANQFEDWAKTTALFVEAESLSLSPENNYEYLPFLRAFYETGNLETALDISTAIEAPSLQTRLALCEFWLEPSRYQSVAPQKARLDGLLKGWQCEGNYD